MPDLDFTGLGEATRAAFILSFADVEQRSRRRRARRLGTALVAGTVAAGLAVAGATLGVPRGSAEPLGPPTNPPYVPTAQPATEPPPHGHHTETGPMVAGDLTHLYLRYGDCHDRDCVILVASTSDGGGRWHKAALPVSHNALVQLWAPTPRTVVAWYQNAGLEQGWLVSTDAGATWRPEAARTVAAVPPGYRPIDPLPGAADNPVTAVDPASGAVVLLDGPRGVELARTVDNLRVTAGLWVTGRGPDGSTVRVSRDGGRNWSEHDFPEPLTVGPDMPGGPAVATWDGQTVYAVGQVGGRMSVYRSLDGGTTWRPTPVRSTIGDARVYAAVRADGTLVVQVGDQPSDHPIRYESADGGATLHPTVLGPGALATPVATGYVQSAWPTSSGAWTSADGIDWRYVFPPGLP